MKTNEIFEHVLQIVCEECELCYGELINGANKNAVDARCLLICALVSLGFSEENTAGTTATLPILIGTNGDTRPLLAYNNEPVTVENIAGTGIYEIHYNKYTNEVYLVNGGYRPTTATAATNVAAKSK